MNERMLSDAIGNINERFVSSAIRHKPKKKYVRRVANFFLVMIIVSFNMTNLFRCGSAQKGDDGSVEALRVMEYNGAYYEEITTDDTDILIRNNLPYEITEDMLGTPLGDATDPLGNDMGDLYTFEPYSAITTEDDRTCRSVYINENDGEYSYMLFCNYISFDDNTHTEFTELLSVYGIDEWEDIESIKIGKTTYTGSEDIKRIFGTFTSSYAMGNDDYRQIIADCGMESESAEQKDTALGEKRNPEDIRIVSNKGVVINNITYYPETDFVYWALSYFKLDEQL